SSARIEGRTVTDFTTTMSGFFAPGMLKKRTPVTPTLGVGSRDRLTGPSITRSRPVAFFTSAVIWGLKLLRSMNDGAISRAKTIRRTALLPPIRSLLRVEGLMFFPFVARPTLAHRPPTRHREN